MKKLLLILALPCLLAASDKSAEQKGQPMSTGQLAAMGATLVVTPASLAYTTFHGTVSIGTSIMKGDYVEAAITTVSTGSKIASTFGAGFSAIDYIAAQPQKAPEQAALDKAYEESAKRQAIAEERAGARLRICLSENAHCSDVNAMGIPTRCNSPARDFAMINRRETDLVIANYVKFTEQRKRSI